jgi:hypothetical protein
LERLNHPSRSTPWKYFTGDELVGRTRATPPIKIATKLKGPRNLPLELAALVARLQGS